MVKRQLRKPVHAWVTRVREYIQVVEPAPEQPHFHVPGIPSTKAVERTSGLFRVPLLVAGAEVAPRSLAAPPLRWYPSLARYPVAYTAAISSRFAQGCVRQAFPK